MFLEVVVVAVVAVVVGLAREALTTRDAGALHPVVWAVKRPQDRSTRADASEVPRLLVAAVVVSVKFAFAHVLPNSGWVAVVVVVVVVT